MSHTPDNIIKVITFGSFDLLHIGHINILKRAKRYGDSLIVGVSSDELHEKKKNRKPVMKYEDRAEIIKSLKFVDDVFKEESMDKKLDYILLYKADFLVMGSDWKGKFDNFIPYCNVLYLPRTENVCSTDLIKDIKEYL